MKNILTILYASFLVAACGSIHQDSYVTVTGKTILPCITSVPLTYTPLETSGKFVNGPRIYLDENPTFAIRQGPGCEYEEIQDRVTKVDPLMFSNVLGKRGNWLLVNLCNNVEGWIFAPAIDEMNIINVNMDDLPILTPPPTPAISATNLPPYEIDKAIDQASNTLITFFDLLHDKNYEEATKIFGGGYGITIMWNPDVDSYDYPTLLMRACEWNGFQCFLRISRIVKAEQISPMEYHFMVEFENEDGSIYQRRYSQENDTTTSQFLFRVVRDCNGKYIVVDWPFYEQYGG